MINIPDENLILIANNNKLYRDYANLVELGDESVKRDGLFKINIHIEEA